MVYDGLSTPRPVTGSILQYFGIWNWLCISGYDGGTDLTLCYSKYANYNSLLYGMSFPTLMLKHFGTFSIARLVSGYMLATRKLCYRNDDRAMRAI